MNLFRSFLRNPRGRLVLLRRFAAQSAYLFFYKHCKINGGIALFESRKGKEFACNMRTLARELSVGGYGKFRIYASCEKSHRKPLRAYLNRCGLKNVTLVSFSGLRYPALLSRAGYLFNDTTFPKYFMKKQGQCIVNTWHGVPLKKMGRDFEENAGLTGNIRKNLLLADYTVFPNRYMTDVMCKAYDLSNAPSGTVLLTGYPRTAALLADKSPRMLDAEGLAGKRVYVYLPTWRGDMAHIDQSGQLRFLSGFLEEMDRLLGDDEVLYVKLHPFVKKAADCTRLAHIRIVPAGYPLYEFLTLADCLITDYSSVFFDFAVTGRKQILFDYDRHGYERARGLYLPLEALPFPKVSDAAQLCAALRSPKEYDDTAFLERFCPHDTPDAAARILARVILKKPVCEEAAFPDNGKENVLIYGGGLAVNGMTTALLSLLARIDGTKRNYIVSFTEQALPSPVRAALIDRKYAVSPVYDRIRYTLAEVAAYVLYFKFNRTGTTVTRLLDRLYRRENERFFGFSRISHAVNFTGYESALNKMLALYPSSTIFVHNDMVNEIKLKNRPHRPTLEAAYRSYRHVAAVTADIIPSIVQISGRRDNIRLVGNIHDSDSVIKKAQEPLTFDPETESTVSPERLSEILGGCGKKFATIGRFSPEKAHARLIDAFCAYAGDKDATLILIGGYGTLYSETLAHAQRCALPDRVVVIRSMRNPMPLLKRCDLFILASEYEGLGLVLLEADTLGVPVFSTDVPGPHGFLTRHGGLLVKNSFDGILSGFAAFDRGEVPKLNIDYEANNQSAVAAFEKLFD
ncbi:MAG: CDP-glycerol glycerophosphotransferase family protein [Oscillospiraceae bacterium]